MGPLNAPLQEYELKKNRHMTAQKLDKEETLFHINNYHGIYVSMRPKQCHTFIALFSFSFFQGTFRGPENFHMKFKARIQSYFTNVSC